MQLILALFILLETLVYSLKGERGEPGPKGMIARIIEQFGNVSLFDMHHKSGCFFIGDPGALGQKVRN